MANLADRIKELREDHDLTRLDMAQKLGVNKSTITRYESGDMNPIIDMLIKIRETFGVTLDWITGVDTIGEDKYLPAIKECMKHIHIENSHDVRHLENTVFLWIVAICRIL